jgi:hypothetical protein
MSGIYIPLLLIFAAFGAFCFNMGHRRAYRIVLKGLLKGQVALLSQRASRLAERKGDISKEELAKESCSYEASGQLVIGWYKSFGMVRDDKELRMLKARVRQVLNDYLSSIEAAGKESSARTDGDTGGEI